MTDKGQTVETIIIHKISSADTAESKLGDKVDNQIGGEGNG